MKAWTNFSRRLQRALLRRIRFDDPEGAKSILAKHFRPPKHSIHSVPVAVPGWPPGPALRIVVLADLHLGSHPGDVERLQQVVEEANALRPDLVLMPGDFVNAMLWGRGRIPPERIARLLAPLRTPLGSYAVLGNHDRDVDGARVERALAANGIAVLENKAIRLPWRGAEIDLVGISDARTGSPDLSLLTGLSGARPALVLTHDPVLFSRLPPGPHLMICGHTHGGQIRLPILGIVTNSSDAPLRWTAGLIEEDRRRLFVSTGLGTSGLPLRVGVPPEIAVLHVTRAAE